ncbi:hypothetical protein GCM10027614_73320 [Micromonospora vulcania]
MRGDLVRKLAARGLSAGLAVLTFVVLALTGATGWGLALAIAALAAAAAERRVRAGADTVAETALIGAAILVGYERRLDAGFSLALAGTALVLLGLVLLVGPLRTAGNLEMRAANLPVRSWTPLIADQLGAALLGLLAVVTLARRWPCRRGGTGRQSAGRRRRRGGRGGPGPAAIPAGHRGFGGGPCAATAAAGVPALLLRAARL